MRLCHLTPFDWKFLRIGTLRAKDLRKNVPILQKGGFTPAPLTLLAIRVVLLHTLYGVFNPLIPQLYMGRTHPLFCWKISCLTFWDSSATLRTPSNIAVLKRGERRMFLMTVAVILQLSLHIVSPKQFSNSGKVNFANPFY